MHSYVMHVSSSLLSVSSVTSIPFCALLCVAGCGGWHRVCVRQPVPVLVRHRERWAAIRWTGQPKPHHNPRDYVLCAVVLRYLVLRLRWRCAAEWRYVLFSDVWFLSPTCYYVGVPMRPCRPAQGSAQRIDTQGVLDCSVIPFGSSLPTLLSIRLLPQPLLVSSSTPSASGGATPRTRRRK